MGLFCRWRWPSGSHLSTTWAWLSTGIVFVFVAAYVFVFVSAAASLFLFVSVLLTQWVSSNDNIGMVFNRQLWAKIVACSNQFCQVAISLLSFHIAQQKEFMQVWYMQIKQLIHPNQSFFSQYDDYNWDWSLQHVSLHCLKQKLQVCNPNHCVSSVGLVLSFEAKSAIDFTIQTLTFQRLNSTR